MLLGIQLFLLAAMLVFTAIVRWRLRNEAAAKKSAVIFPAAVDVDVFEDRRSSHMYFEDRASPPVYFGDYSVPPPSKVAVPPATPMPPRYECAVCCAPTSTRCSRCKSVRYCSSKCQIIHWRQGHKYECHPLAPNDSDRGYSNGFEERLDQYETNDSELVEGPRKSSKNTVRYDSSESHFLMPRLSTVTNDPLDYTNRQSCAGEHDKPVSDNHTLKNNTVVLNSSSELMRPGLVNSVKKLNREKSRHVERRRSKVSSSDMTLELKKNSFSEGADSVNLHCSKSKEFPDVGRFPNEGQESSLSGKHVEAKSLPITPSLNSSLQSRSKSNSSHSPHPRIKSSIQKAEHNLKTSHQKTPPIQNNLLQTSLKHGDKAILDYGTFLKMYSLNELELKPFGLINCGNSCYANAVLQCLTYTRPLTLYFLLGLHSKECWKKEWCFICEFELLIHKAREGRSPLSPIRILSNISHLGHGKQEDAHEFLRYAVDTMQSVCVQLARFEGPMVEETTLISMTFGGYLHSKIKCMKCHGKSEKYDRMMDLTVEIDGNIRTLEQALKRFTGYEILEGDNKYHCGRCRSYEKAKKKLSIFEAPNILTIVLKRFQAGTFTKLTKLIQFPEKLDLAPFMSHSSDRHPQYSLYAVIVHLDVKSAAFCGHYVCYVKNYHEEWFKIDDSVVVSVDLKSVLSEEAYILLYSRQSPRPSVLAKTVADGKLAEVHLHAVPSRHSGQSSIPNSRRKSSDPLMMQHQPSRKSYAKDPSYLEEWVTHSVESIPRVESSSEVSSLFSPSEEGTCSTPSTKESASVEDFSDYIFGRGSAAGC